MAASSIHRPLAAASPSVRRDYDRASALAENGASPPMMSQALSQRAGIALIAP
jgi:hypothetical protein